MHKYILLAGLLLLTYFTKAQQNTKARIDSVMQVAYQRGVFNGNILVARKGKIIYKKAWGYADGRRKKLLTTDMRFDIGSISKEFNGTGIMLLKERGKLSLDDPISKFMPLLPPWAHRVNIRHLINYTSGIPLFDATSAETDNQILGNLMALKALSFEPGSAYIYNHYNVYLQERIIEKVSGLPYADFITENILKPCGINNTIINYPVNGAGMARAFNNEFIETPYAQAMTGWLRLPVTDLYKWTENLHTK
jgi:CubicO group peptidase (beta-lactamase class C family)